MVWLERQGNEISSKPNYGALGKYCKQKSVNFESPINVYMY